MCESTEERITKYRPLVYIEAAKWGGLLEFDDACSYGMIGLVQAAHLWKPDSYAFATLAKRRIKLCIIDGVRTEHGRFGKKREFRRATGSLENTALVEYIEAPNATEEVAIEEMDKMRLAKAIRECLDPQSAAILDLRFGANWSLREIARLYGLTENKVGQIIRQALAKLRFALADSGITSLAEAIS